GFLQGDGAGGEKVAHHHHRAGGEDQQQGEPDGDGPGEAGHRLESADQAFDSEGGRRHGVGVLVEVLVVMAAMELSRQRQQAGALYMNGTIGKRPPPGALCHVSVTKRSYSGASPSDFRWQPRAHWRLT